MRANSKQIAEGLDLFPISIVAIGCSTGPTARLMALQSAVAKAVAVLAAIHFPRVLLLRSAWLRLRAQ